MGDDRYRSYSFSRLSQLLELDVVDVDGEIVGRIDDLLLDACEGSIQYVRLAFDDAPRADRTSGPAPEPRRLLTVPWSAIRIESRTTPHNWRIAARRATLERLAREAPPLTRDRE